MWDFTHMCNPTLGGTIGSRERLKEGETLNLRVI